jgi:hypothetical protein
MKLAKNLLKIVYLPFRDARFMPKHLRYALSMLAGGIFMFLAVSVPFQYIFLTLPVLLIIYYILVWFAIYENIDGVEWIMLFMMPLLWVIGWYIFFYMIPVRWLTRIIFTTIFSIIFYVLISVENIYNVGVEKNIQLKSAALTVSAVFFGGLGYLIFHTISVFDTYWLIFGLLAGIISWIFAIKFFWITSPATNIHSWQIKHANFVGFIMFFVTITLNFLPFSSEALKPIIMAGILHLVLNSVSDSRDEIVFDQKHKEYLLVFAIIIVITIIGTSR